MLSTAHWTSLHYPSLRESSPVASEAPYLPTAASVSIANCKVQPIFWLLGSSDIKQCYLAARLFYKNATKDNPVSTSSFVIHGFHFYI